MARHAEIEAFAEKLRLVLGRANLSRTALAQLIGVDKSVVARWSSGALHPADHSLAALSAALGRIIAGFDRTAWDLPMPGFAHRIGARPPPDAAAAAAIASPLDFALEASSAGLADAAAAYGGIWLLIYPAMGRPGELVGFAARMRLREGGGALGLEFTNGGSVGGDGIAFAIQVRLHILIRLFHQRDTLGFLLFDGVTDEVAEILDGIALARAATADRSIGAGRMLFLRLSDAIDDATYEAAVARSSALNRDSAWEGLATPAMLASYAQPPPGPATRFRQTRIAQAESWTIGRRGLRRPDAAPQREALAKLRASFRGHMPNLPDERS